MPPKQHRWVSSTRFRFALAIAASSIIVALLLWQVTLSELVRILRETSVGWFCVAVVFYVTATVIRATRFALLMRVPVRRLCDLLAVAFAHSVSNNILPARTGELSFVYLMKSNFGSPLARGAGALVLMRLLDYLQVMLFFVLIAVVALGSLPGDTRFIVAATAVSFVLAIVALGIVIWFSQHRFQCLTRFVPDRIREQWVASKVAGAALEMINVFAMLKESRAILMLAWQTSLVWVAYFGMYHCLLLAVDVHVAPWQTVIASTFSVFAMAVPWVTPAGFGIVETGWAAGLMLVGLQKEVAIASSFAVHILTLFAVLPTGIWGWLHTRRMLPENGGTDVSGHRAR